MSGGDGQHFRFDLPPGVSPEILLHRIPIPRPTIPPRGIPSEYKSNKAWFKRHMRDPHKHHIIFLVRVYEASWNHYSSPSLDTFEESSNMTSLKIN